MNTNFPQYDTDYISGVMSLRTPQKKSLEILDSIYNSLNIKKSMNLDAALGSVHALYPTCTSFERDFLSLTFAIATGVGKTRLMGAFIAYLFTQHSIKNYFVVAPNMTIYNKLRNDFSDTTSSKYVFKGLGCFSTPPQIFSDEDYNTNLGLFESDVRIFIFNIDKFNSEDSKMRKVHELIGDSFYNYLSNLDDLVLLMDESHHYRANRGLQSLNDLHPVLGLELTATPFVKSGSKQVPFKNVVYEYPLSQAIADGYTRTPYALTRSDVHYYNFGDEEIDKLMLTDGIQWHEKIKKELIAFSENSNGEYPVVKPFMMVVCKDTDHAKWVENFIKSDEFRNGDYKDPSKTIIVHSKQTGSESEENTKLLLDVEKTNNPVEIVIHVNMLKEGWDVNNLFTIVPLRTASSKILREQMVGRGLRLPFGKRVGEDNIDSVVLTAHDKFEDIIAEAKKGDSIFKQGNIIKAEDIKETKVETSQPSLQLGDGDLIKKAIEQTKIERTGKTEKIIEAIHSITLKYVVESSESEFVKEDFPTEIIMRKVEETLSKDKDLADVYYENQNVLLHYADYHAKEVIIECHNKYIPIPRIRVTEPGEDTYMFYDFDIDLNDFHYAPIESEILIRNLTDGEDQKRIVGESINFEGFDAKKELLQFIREKPEIDYERCGQLLKKCIISVCNYFISKFGESQLNNIVLMYKKDISNKIYNQMMKHFYYGNDLIHEEIIGMNSKNIPLTYSFEERVKLFEDYTSENIKSVLFDGIKKGVFESTKFDSNPELLFARIIESDGDVLNWLRPSSKEFNITYNRGRQYDPDFVVETDKMIYLVEVKGEDKLNDPDVIAKKNRAIQYCQIASDWSKANGYKEWRHLFIPSMQIYPNSSFKNLATQFEVNSLV